MVGRRGPAWPGLARACTLPAVSVSSPFWIYAIAVIALGGVVLRPWRTPEVAWAGAGAAVLVLARLVPVTGALPAIAKGTDVYLFLIGMMLLSASAEREGLFDHLAAICVARARGSGTRLFLLVYAVGTVVTIFMSNDATAVVLTPAVLAVTRQAKAKPLPYLLACALIANAASFVLPISNPANLVVFGDKLPALGPWIARFLLPSALSIGVTCAVLLWLSRRDLAGPPRSRWRCRGRGGRDAAVAHGPAGGRRHRRHGGRAAHGVCSRRRARPADLARRGSHGGADPVAQAGSALAGARPGVVVDRAAGGEPVRDRRGPAARRIAAAADRRPPARWPRRRRPARRSRRAPSWRSPATSSTTCLPD